MAILGAISIARSGLIATGEALSVTSNNIANVNTTAYKGGRSEFVDLLASDAAGARSTGLGTRLDGVSSDLSQGEIESTGRSTDIAIQGNGFFVVRAADGEGFLYTRVGSFAVNADGEVTTRDGYRLQGFELDAANRAIGGPVDVSFGAATGQPKATSKIELENNLDATAELVTGGFDSTDFDTAYATSNFTTTARVYDTRGVGHDLVLFFTRTGDNAWDLNIGVDAVETGGTEGELSILGTMALTFNTDGSLAGPDPTDISVTFAGADAQTITVDAGTPNTTATAGLGLDGVTQFGSASNVSADPDGYAAGQLESIEIGSDGIVRGVFDNDQSRDLFRLALADFAAPGELIVLGSGLYSESAGSGVATISTPEEAGMGRLVGASLERSNVDLAEEFVDLISLQRSFQASSRVITTGDSLLNDLINIVR